MPASRAEILRMLDKLERLFGVSFRNEAAKIRTAASIHRTWTAVEARDLEAAIAAAGVRAGSWSAMTETLRQAYFTAGVFTLLKDVPARFGAQFNISNPRAETWLRTQSSRLVTLITREQREAVRIVMQAGMAAGRAPRSVALDIVGRISKQTGRRSGGVIGLNGPQASAVKDMRAALSNPRGVGIVRFDQLGDPVKSFWIGRDGNLKSSYARRDRRFDPMVRRAIESGTPLDEATINRLVGRYEDRLLDLRGQTVGRTEALASLNEASDEALRQAVDEGLAPPDAVKRIWDATGDLRTRPDHVAADGQPRGLSEPFIVGGMSMMHPGDPAGGAANVINCRCIVRHEIDFVKVEQAA